MARSPAPGADPAPGLRQRRIERALLIVILLLGAWLRLSRLDLIEYKADEAMAIELTLPLVEGRGWIAAGLVSSVGVHNPPMLMYLLALPLAIDVDPITAVIFVALLSIASILATYLVMRPRFGAFAALGSAALFATAPWAVIFGRKIWAQDLLPIFSIALLYCVFVVLERPKSRWAFALALLTGTLWQLHFSAIAVLPIVGVILLYAARRVSWTALGAGALLALLLAAPYVQYHVVRGWKDVQSFREISRAPGRPKPPLLQPIIYTAQITGSHGWSYMTGDSQQALADSAPVADRAAWIASAISSGLLLIGVIVLTTRVLSGFRRSPRSGLDAQEERYAVLLLWLGGVCALTVAGRLITYPHYFVLTYPAPFVIIALGLEWCKTQVARWQPRPAMMCTTGLLVAICAAFVAFDLSFVRFLDKNGGTAGDYGTVYRYKDQAARFALQRGVGPSAVKDEIASLIELRRRHPHPEPPAKGGDYSPAGRVIEIRDRFRESDIVDCPRELRRRFGPISTCIGS
jgi:4-amino-4-deoxy-L-arabinose transferase-like glycosyltransferase